MTRDTEYEKLLDIDPNFKERELQILKEKDKSWKYKFNSKEFNILIFEMKFEAIISLAVSVYKAFLNCKEFTMYDLIKDFETPLSDREKEIKDAVNRYFKYNGKFLHELSPEELNTKFSEMEITCLWLKKS